MSDVEIRREHWASGSIREEVPYRDGVRSGMCVGWHHCGRLHYKQPWKNGKIHGVYLGYRIDRSVYYLKYYIYGKMASKEEWREHRLMEQLAGI